MVKEGRTLFTPGALMEALGTELGEYVFAVGTMQNFIQPINSSTALVGNNLAVRARMTEMAETETLGIGDAVKYVKDGKVYKGRVKKTEGGKHTVEFDGDKPSGHHDEKRYDQSELGRDDDE
jgi:hypothetical protein